MQENKINFISEMIYLEFSVASSLMQTLPDRAENFAHVE